MSTNRYKNPYFWIGIFSAILAASGIQPSDLTSWSLMADALMSILANPFTLGGCAMAVLAIFMNPNTSGILD